MDEIKAMLPPAASHVDRQYQNQTIKHARQVAENPGGHQNDTQLRAACNEMESLFINYLFKEMRATIDKSGFISGGRGEEIFTSLLDVEMSRKISGTGGIGLSAILLEQLGGKKE